MARQVPTTPLMEPVLSLRVIIVIILMFSQPVFLSRLTLMVVNIILSNMDVTENTHQGRTWMAGPPLIIPIFRKDEPAGAMSRVESVMGELAAKHQGRDRYLSKWQRVLQIEKAGDHFESI